MLVKGSTYVHLKHELAQHAGQQRIPLDLLHKSQLDFAIVYIKLQDLRTWEGGQMWLVALVQRARTEGGLGVKTAAARAAGPAGRLAGCPPKIIPTRPPTARPAWPCCTRASDAACPKNCNCN